MLTDRFGDALAFAEALHRGQTRKGANTPYISHLLAVASMVLEWTTDEDVVIAALLHDAVEDQGGVRTAEEIRDRYGDYVAELVLACTDSLSEDPRSKEPWIDRKRRHVSKLASASADVALITAADKLHNVTAILRDVRTAGPQTLQRFNSPNHIGWYYTAVAIALSQHEAVAPVAELRTRAAELVALLGGAAGKVAADL